VDISITVLTSNAAEATNGPDGWSLHGGGGGFRADTG